MAFLSQASHLGSLLLPHDAFQEHAAHVVEWSTTLVGRIRARYLTARLPNPPVRPVRETFASYGSRERVGGAFLSAPSTLCGFPVPAWGKQVLPCALLQSELSSPHRVLLSPSDFGLDWLTYQARYVRVPFSRRAMHTSGDSPYYLSAKHGVLRACLPLTAPFRSMLLTLRGGPQCSAPKAHRVPVY